MVDTVKKVKRKPRKVQENDLTKNKEFCEALEKMIKTNPISDEELVKLGKGDKD